MALSTKSTLIAAASILVLASIFYIVANVVPQW